MSLTLDSTVVAFDGLANDEPSGTPACHSDLDDNTDFSTSARLVCIGTEFAMREIRLMR